MIVIVFDGTVYDGFVAVEQAVAALTILGFEKCQHSPGVWLNSEFEGINYFQVRRAEIVETEPNTSLAGQVERCKNKAREARKSILNLPRKPQMPPHSY